MKSNFMIGALYSFWKEAWEEHKTLLNGRELMA